MRTIRTLLLLVLTLFWAVISFLFYASTSSYFSLTVIAFIYGLLVYLVWPIGTVYYQVAAKRIFFVLGGGVLLIALDVTLTKECGQYPYYLGLMYPKQSGVAAIILAACNYLGKYPAAFMLVGVSGYFIYLGNKCKPNHTIKRGAPQAPRPLN